MATYILHFDMAFSANNQANRAETLMNEALVARRRSERVVKTGLAISFHLEGLSEQEAVEYNADLTTAWGPQGRTGGVASITRADG